jgi:hypothetical protein
MTTLDAESLRGWITAFFVLAAFAAVLSVVGFAMLLPRRAVRPPGEAHVAPVATRERVLEGAGARS